MIPKRFLILAIAALPLVAPAQSAPSLPSDAAAFAGAASEGALNAWAAARRGGSVNRGAANVNRGANINRKTNINRNVNVIVRPVRPWVRRPYYGAVVAGVTLGTIIAVTTIPPAPSSDVCWYWSNSSHTPIYWDHCQ